jgi:Tol biopolymer transport system component
VFQSVRDGQTDLWLLRERAWGLRQPRPERLTAGPLSFVNPVFSRDGTKIFVVGSPSQGELVRYDVERRELITSLRGLSATHLTFSPDRQFVAYIGWPDLQLWRARADGSDKQALTYGPFESNDATWSPDGRHIAFRSRMSGNRLRIHLVDPNGGEPRPISSENVEQGVPSWSPDGKRLAFGDVPPGFGRPRGSEVLHIYDLTSGAFSDVPDSGGLWSCRWSPDGRYLAALTIVGQELRLFDFEQRQWRSVGVDHVSSPVWSRDGGYIYYLSEGPGPLRLFRVRVGDGERELLEDLSDDRVLAYWWVGLTPDDAPLLLRTRGATEIYALELEQ